MIAKTENHPDHPFIVSDKTLLPDQTTRLCQMFTHKQSKSDFLRCAQNLHRSASISMIDRTGEDQIILMYLLFQVTIIYHQRLLMSL